MPESQNGTGLPYYSRELLDSLGRKSLTMDERGFITRFSYDNATGAMVRRVDDVDPELDGEVPSSWALVSPGLNWVTDYQCDTSARVLREFGPVHEVQLRIDNQTVEPALVRTVRYTVYRDDLRQVWNASGYARGSGPNYTFVTVGSVRITCKDEEGRVTDEIEAVRACNQGPLAEQEMFPRDKWRRWTRQIYDIWGRLLARRVYHRLPESGQGEKNYNYDESCFGYDNMDRQNRQVSPGGTITRSVFDARNLMIGQWVGTNDAGATDDDPTGGGTPGNNMVLVLSNEYDYGEDGGDGLRTKAVRPVDSSSDNNRDTDYTYDFRGRLVNTLSTDGTTHFISRNLYDNLDRVIGVDTYHTSVDVGNLTGRTRRYFDSEGRIFKDEIYSVNPSTGEYALCMVGEKWYDPTGNVVRETQPGNEAITLMTYDSLGREVMRYLAYEPSSDSSSSQSTSSHSDSSQSSESTSSSETSSSSLSSSSSEGTSSSSESSESSYVIPYSSSEEPPPESSSSEDQTSGGTSSSSATSSSSELPYSSSSSGKKSGTPPCEPCSSTCKITGKPVRLSNGQIMLDETDLSTQGFVGWAHTRSYGNLLEGEGSGCNGNLWFVVEFSSLLFGVGDLGDCILATQGANSSIWFRPDGSGGWTPMFDERSTLVHDVAGARFVLTTPEGYRYVYFDESTAISSPLRGRLESFADPYGLTVEMGYNSSFQMIRFAQSDGFQSNVFAYEYLPGGAGVNAGQLERVRLEVNGVPVREAVYDYFGFAESGGGPRDLKRATIREYNTTTSAWVTIRRTAYRYYVAGEPGGCVNGLKFELRPESYARMTSVGLDPMTVSDAVWAEYADKYFEYDSSRRVVLEKTRGGQETYTLSFLLNPEAPDFEDYNVWNTRTVEARPNGAEFTIYTNRAGLMILSKLQDEDGGIWYEYVHYNEQGRVELQAMPSAVESVIEPDESSNVLTVVLKDHEGLVKVNTFYAATIPETGAVATYLEMQGVREGADGHLFVTRRLTYDTHMVNGVSIHPVATEEVYPEDGLPGNVTHYGFAWYDTNGEMLGGLEDLPVHPGNETELDDLVVIEQHRSSWNEVSQQILITSWQRFDTSNEHGPLNGPEGPEPKARRSYHATWFDGIGRIVATANYGTNGGMELARPGIAPLRSDIVLVNTTHYKDEGDTNATIDANGIETRWQNDAVGRRIRLVENFRAGFGAGSPDVNRTSDYAYAPDGGLARMTLINESTGDQVTSWEYGTTLAESQLARSDLLRTKVFPSATDTVNACSELNPVVQRVQYRYNRQSQTVEMKDPNGTVHVYDFDKLGRQTQDRVTVVAAHIDDGVRRIQTTYDLMRLLRWKVTSYDNAEIGEGSILNEVAFEYDKMSLLSGDRQAHTGPVELGTPSVLYHSALGTSNSTRRQYMVYPDSVRTLFYGYGVGDGVDDRLSRVGSLNIAGEMEDVCRYAYVGSGRCVNIAYPQPNVRLSYRKPSSAAMGDAGDPYNGYDRFGRTVDMRWLHGGEDGTMVDRIQYGYDRANNRTWRKNLAATSGDQDQAWTYDGLYQVKSGALGALNINQTAIGGVPARAEAWNYDPTGNWQRWQKSTEGELQLDQTRIHNRDNQITQIDGKCDGIAYDKAGNTLMIPPDAAGDWSVPQSMVWDAWNRLVAVRHADGDVIALYAYDGLYRRIMKLTEVEILHYYYNDQWKCIEERAAEPPTSSSSEEPPPESTSSSSSMDLMSSSSSGSRSSEYSNSSSSSSEESQSDSSQWSSESTSSSISEDSDDSVSSSSSSPPSSSSIHDSESSSDSNSEIVVPAPVLYYECGEELPEDALLNSMGMDCNFTPSLIEGPPPLDGKCGGGRGLGSGKWFSAPDANEFNPGLTSPLYISLWFKPNALGGMQVLISKEREYQLILVDDTHVVFRIATTSASGWDKTVQVPYSMEDDNWYHAIAWVFPQQFVGLRVDSYGDVVVPLGPDQGIYDGNSNINLGHAGTAPSTSSDSSSSSASISSEEELLDFVGTIDEIAFFDTELYMAQMDMLYNGGSGWYYRAGWGPCPGSMFMSVMGSGGGTFGVLSIEDAQNQLQSAGSLESELKCQYVWGARPGHRDELVLRDEAEGEGSERLWCLMDYYDPISIVNNGGDVEERYRFSTFGLRNIMAPNFAIREVSHFDWKFGYKGQFVDSESNLYNYGYRYYGPELGRWLSRDPIGEKGGSNVYANSKNDPTGSIDYLGLATCIVNSFKMNVLGWKASGPVYPYHRSLRVNFEVDVCDKDDCKLGQDRKGIIKVGDPPVVNDVDPDWVADIDRKQTNLEYWWAGKIWLAGNSPSEGFQDWDGCGFLYRNDCAIFTDDPGFVAPHNKGLKTPSVLSRSYRTWVKDRATDQIVKSIEWFVYIYLEDNGGTPNELYWYTA